MLDITFRKGRPLRAYLSGMSELRSGMSDLPSGMSDLP